MLSRYPGCGLRREYFGAKLFGTETFGSKGSDVQVSSAIQSTGSKIEAHVWRIAAVVVLGTIMSVLDTTIVNVALDTLGRDLNASVDQIQWVVTGYLLALAAVIPVSGWASRRFS